MEEEESEDERDGLMVGQQNSQLAEPESTTALFQPICCSRRCACVYVSLLGLLVALFLSDKKHGVLSPLLFSDSGAVEKTVAESDDHRSGPGPWEQRDEPKTSPTFRNVSGVPVRLVPVLSSDNSGASWFLNELANAYPQLFCLAADDDLLDPDWVRLFDTTNPELSPDCSYAFTRDAIQKITASFNDNDGSFREFDTDSCLNISVESLSHGKMADIDWVEWMPDLCQWVGTLQGTNYTSDDILILWLEVYLSGSLWRMDSQCRSHSHCGSTVPQQTNGIYVAQPPWKGLHVMAEWLPRWPANLPWDPIPVNLNVSAISGERIIYVRRTNMLARFLSSSDPSYSGKRGKQLINTEKLLSQFTWFRHMDDTSFAWATDHARPFVWTVDYEECQIHIESCLREALTYLGGVDNILPSPQGDTASKGKAKTSYSDADGIMDHIQNALEVKEALFANSFGSFSGVTEPYNEVRLLLHDTDPTVVRSRHFPGVHIDYYVTQDKSKWATVVALLADTPPDTLVVLGDADRGVIHQYLYPILTAFKSRLVDRIGVQNAIILSTSTFCCVPAMTTMPLGSLFSADGRRSGHTNDCDESNKTNKNCPNVDTNGTNDETEVWRDFMSNMAAQRKFPNAQTLYLDAGLMAGKAEDLKLVLEMAGIQADEDATAVLTDLMRHSPNLILLDYNQDLFGTYRSNPIDAHNSNDGGANTSYNSSINSIPKLMMHPFVLQKSKDTTVNRNGTLTAKYPVWGSNGILLKPILDHIKRVAENTSTLLGIDESFGPEVPYFIDEDGLWSFDLIRNRTSPGIVKWRLDPIEGIMKLGFRLLTGEKNATTRWPAVQKSLESGGFPFFAWYGDYKSCNFKNYNEKESIPILTNSATVGCNYSFPTPSYQQIFDARTDRYHPMFQLYAKKYPFESKIHKVVWRGSLSDNNVDKIFEHVRWRLCEMVYKSKSPFFDVGLTRIPLHNSIAQGNLSQVGGLASFISPMEDYQRFLAVLDMDGNSWSSRFGTLLCYNSVVIKVEPLFVDYFHYDLTPWTHYVPIRNDLSDLIETVEYVMDPKNAEVVADIIAAANQWCAARFNPDRMANDMMDVMESYVRKLDQSNPNWSDEWKQKKAELLFAADLDIVQL